MITLADYWMGRDKAYAKELTLEIRANATETLRRVNLLLELAAADGVEPAKDQITGNAVPSGWRPSGINDRTANAAKASTHLTGEGIDIQDHIDRRLAIWCLKNKAHLKRIGLWCEDPRWTAGKTGKDPWVHFQKKPPKSGRRFYVPSTAPPQSAPLPGQNV